MFYFSLPSFFKPKFTAMVKRFQALDTDGNPIDVYFNGDANISEIDPQDEWRETLQDEDGNTEVVEFVGPVIRPRNPR